MRSHRFGRFLVMGLVAVLGFTGVQADDVGRELPRATQLRWIEASIRAVHDNGVADRVSREFGIQKSDGTRTMPIKHVVICETEPACVGVARWARRAGLAPSTLRTEFRHGGVPYYLISLRQHLRLESKQVQYQALQVHQALVRIPDTRYDTWMLDVDPEGNRDAR